MGVLSIAANISKTPYEIALPQSNLITVNGRCDIDCYTNEMEFPTLPDTRFNVQIVPGPWLNQCYLNVPGEMASYSGDIRTTRIVEIVNTTNHQSLEVRSSNNFNTPEYVNPNGGGDVL